MWGLLWELWWSLECLDPPIVKRVVLFGRTMRSVIRFVCRESFPLFYREFVPILTLRTAAAVWPPECWEDVVAMEIGLFPSSATASTIMWPLNCFGVVMIDVFIYCFECFDCHFIGVFVCDSANVFVWCYGVFLISGSGRRCSMDPLRGPMKRRPSYKWCPFCDILSCDFVTERFLFEIFSIWLWVYIWRLRPKYADFTVKKIVMN